MNESRSLYTIQQFPCKDCPDRHPCCWGACPRYQEAVAENEKKKEYLKGPYAGSGHTAAWYAKDKWKAKRYKTRNRYMKG